jgi:hypothetical protein
MKKIALFCFVLCSTVSFAQKVDLDRFYFDVSFQDLPEEVVPFEQRTYATTIVTDGPISKQFESAKILNNDLYISGWKKVSEKPTITLVLNLADFFEAGTKVNSRTVEEKDKDGKVTNSYPMYTITTTYRGNANGTLISVLKPKETPTPVAVVEAPKPTNRFLKSTNQEVPKVENTNDQKRFNLSGDVTYTTGESKSLATLEKANEQNRRNDFNVRLRQYVNDCIAKANYRLNNTYGFSPITFKEQLWIMDSKEEEGAIQKEAIEAVKLQFSGMKADQPIDKLTADLQPLIEYFESLKTKYTEDNKGSKKIRYSAYYNLGKIYLYLDQPEKAIKEGEGLIANDYDKKDGKDIIDAGTKLVERFNKTQLRTRHNPSL